MPSEVGERAQQPVLVIPAELPDAGRDFLLEPEEGVDARLRVGTPVDIVTKEHDHVPFVDDRSELAEQVVQRSEVRMDVSDGDGRHSPFSPGASAGRVIADAAAEAAHALGTVRW
jgi:hypothetical protein